MGEARKEAKKRAVTKKKRGSSTSKPDGPKTTVGSNLSSEQLSAALPANLIAVMSCRSYQFILWGATLKMYAWNS